MTEGHPNSCCVPQVIYKTWLDIDGRNTEKFMAAVSDSAEIHLYLH
jgi:hypothetical protein